MIRDIDSLIKHLEEKLDEDTYNQGITYVLDKIDWRRNIPTSNIYWCKSSNVISVTRTAVHERIRKEIDEEHQICCLCSNMNILDKIREYTDYGTYSRFDEDIIYVTYVTNLTYNLKPKILEDTLKIIIGD